MADPTALTAIVGAVAGVIGAATPIVLERRHDKRAERDAETTAEVASWTGLNEALGREIERLTRDIDRIRSDYEAALAKQRADHEAAMAQQRAEHEKQLNTANKRIAELETDVASLKRILGQPPK